MSGLSGTNVVFASRRNKQQENIPVECILPTFLVRGEGSAKAPFPWMQTPWRQTPLNADPSRGRFLRLEAGHVTCDACWEANHHHPTPLWTE